MLNNINSLVTLNFNLDSKLKIKHEQIIKIVTKMLKDLDVKTSFSLEYFVDCEFDYDAICQIQNDYIQITYEHRSWTHRVNIALDKFTIENILQEVLSFCEFNYFLDVC